MRNLFKKDENSSVHHNLRSQKAKRNIAGSLVVKGCSILIGFIIIPITINYVNPAQYGLWLTLSSVIGWFSFFDIGFGNGLRNKFAEAVASGNHQLGKVLVSTTYAILTIIMLIVFILFFCINPFLDWSRILNAPETMSRELGLLAIIVLGFFSIQLVLQLINTVATANQEPAVASLLALVSNVISLLLILILVKTTKGNLLYLGVTLSITPIIVFVAASAWLYMRRYRSYSPALKHVNFAYAAKLGSLGIKFFVLQIGAVILFQTNNIIITQLFGPTQVTSYNIVYKYFASAFMLFGIIVSPFWTAFTDAWVKGEIGWIKSILNKLKMLFIFLVILLLIMLLLSNQVYKVWIGKNLIIPFNLSVIVSICIALQIWQSIFLQFLNGISKIMLQLYLVICVSIVNIPLALFLGKRFGVSGVVSSSVILFFIIGIVMYIQADKLLNQKANGLWNR